MAEMSTTPPCTHPHLQVQRNDDHVYEMCPECDYTNVEPVVDEDAFAALYDQMIEVQIA